MRSFLGSVTFVGAERGFFWALWDSGLMHEGNCVDCGFARDVAEALASMRAVPCVDRHPLHLLPARAAQLLFAAVWAEPDEAVSVFEHEPTGLLATR